MTVLESGKSRWAAGETIVHRLARVAAERLDDRAFTFVASTGAQETWTYGALWAAAASRAREVAARVRPGARVLVLEPSGLDYLAALFGVMAAGATAVPLLPPRSARNAERLAHVVRAARAELALAPAQVQARFADAGLRLPWAPAAVEAAGDTPVRAELDGTAVLQFTSGSTGDPKGVVLGHRPIRANITHIHDAFPFEEGLRWVGWLPLQHDMGLVGNVLAPVAEGQACTLMAPETFLMRPARWLQAVSETRANISGGPDFAYALCADRVRDADLEGLDLSSWRVAFVGAEPVRAVTLDRFAERFAGAGFRREAFFPCYGLAEATLFVASGPPERRARVFELDPGALARGWMEPRSGGRRFVGHGGARPGQTLAVVDPETGARAAPTRVGELWIRGPNVAEGYLDRPEDTAFTFGRVLDGQSGWLRTGDLGGVIDGELIVTGRSKDMIVVGGHNVYPQDIERAVEASVPQLSPGGTIAFSVDDGAAERVVLVTELKRDALRGPLSEVGPAARAAAFRSEGVAIDELVLLRPGGLPRTTSGKPRRRACRDAYLSGRLPALTPREKGAQ